MLYEISLDRGYGRFPFTFFHYSGENRYSDTHISKDIIYPKVKFPVRINQNNTAISEKRDFHLGFFSKILWSFCPGAVSALGYRVLDMLY